MTNQVGQEKTVIFFLSKGEITPVIGVIRL